MNAIYDLPFKKETRAISGWEVASIVSVQTGNPTNVCDSGLRYTSISNRSLRWFLGPINVTGNPLGQWIVPTGVDASGNPFFANTFQIPTNTLGNLGGNTMLRPGFADADLSW